MALFLEFNDLCYLRKLSVTNEAAEPLAGLMTQAHREQRREEATERTIGRIYRTAIKLRRSAAVRGKVRVE
jgi:hypothetical protein